MFPRALVALCLFLLPLNAQTPSQAPPAQVAFDLIQALIGQWTGILEYRDYSEPPTSTKRVQLPTWLTITEAAGVLTEHYVYDDGPGKTVDSAQTVTFNPESHSCTEQEPSRPAHISQVTGFDTLKSGRGELILLGQGVENKKPAETRTTLSIRRNLLTWVEEVRPADTQEPFAFRHRYTFTRTISPTLSVK